MTTVITTYFFTARECLGPLMTTFTGDPHTTWIIGIVIGITLAIVLFSFFLYFIGIKQRGTMQEQF
jgi:ABC-type multidrug transport system permease subunit